MEVQLFLLLDYFLKLKDKRWWKWVCPKFCSASSTLRVYWPPLWWVRRGHVCGTGDSKPRPAQSLISSSARSTWRVCAHFTVTLHTHSQDQFIKSHILKQPSRIGPLWDCSFVPVCECLCLCPDSCCSEKDVQDLSGSVSGVDNSHWDKCGVLSPL